MASGRVSYAGKAATIYFSSEADRERARNAFRVRGGVEGYTAETEWWADLIMQQVETWETSYNGGQPFEIESRRKRARETR